MIRVFQHALVIIEVLKTLSIQSNTSNNSDYFVLGLRLTVPTKKMSCLLCVVLNLSTIHLN